MTTIQYHAMFLQNLQWFKIPLPSEEQRRNLEVMSYYGLCVLIRKKEKATLTLVEELQGKIQMAQLVLNGR